MLGGNIMYFDLLLFLSWPPTEEKQFKCYMKEHEVFWAAKAKTLMVGMTFHKMENINASLDEVIAPAAEHHDKKDEWVII